MSTTRAAVSSSAHDRRLGRACSWAGRDAVDRDGAERFPLSAARMPRPRAWRTLTGGADIDAGEDLGR
jgi:hypothetical protein